MSAVQAVEAAKFLRKTTLREGESNTNFKMLDDDVAEAITSAEADEVTPLMSKIYTRLLLTPSEMREGERVLRFAGQEREGKWMTAWEQLRGHLRVSGETASKALRWMHKQGIIGYYAGKNGVGIRIFLNRAARSVAAKREARPQKIFSFARASDGRLRTTPSETPFNDSYAVSESLETDLNPRAPKNGAEDRRATPDAFAPLDEVVSRLKYELEPVLQSMARQAAAREHEQTRTWLESSGLPKAARVAQRETYNVLRSRGVIKDGARSQLSDAGRSDYAPAAPRVIAEDEVGELAEACLALFEAKGRAVEVTLAEMCVTAGGFLLPEDASRVLEKVKTLRGPD